MANTINADSGAISGVPGVKTTADTSGVLALQADGTTIATISTTGLAVAGGVSFPAGSAAAPSIAPTGDPNTGMFFPAADTIAFSEGGTEAMRLTSAGYAGFGTTDPQAKVDVRGNLRVGYGSEQGLITAEGFGAKLVLNQTGGEGSKTTELRAEGLLLSFGTDLTLQTASYNLIFKTNFTERFRIGTSGQLGIGGANYGTSGQVLTSNGSGAAPSWQLPAGLPTMNVVTGTTQTAVANNHYVLTNVAATTVTLPAGPAAGDVVWVTVANGRVDNVVARNGQNINSLAENMTIDSAYAGVQLRYADATRGWVFT